MADVDTEPTESDTQHTDELPTSIPDEDIESAGSDTESEVEERYIVGTQQPSASTSEPVTTHSCKTCEVNKENLSRLQETFRRSKLRREQLKSEVKELRRLNRVLEKV